MTQLALRFGLSSAAVARITWDRLRQAANQEVRPDVGASALLLPLVFVLCWQWGVSPNYNLANYLGITILLMLFAAAIASAALIVSFWLPSQRRNRLVTNAPLAWTARQTLLFSVMTWIYSHLKAGALVGGTYDEWLASIGRTISFGTPWWKLCQRLVPDCFADLLAVVYIAFLPVLVSCTIWLALTNRRRRADEMTCAIVLCYYLGALGYLLLPAYGPAFVDPNASPEHLSDEMYGLQRTLLEHVRAVQTDPATVVIQPWRYIAAFPSLHAAGVLVALWYLRRERTARKLMTWFAVLTAISTLYFAWHHLIDWLGGAAVAVLAVRLTGTYFRDERLT